MKMKYYDKGKVWYLSCSHSCEHMVKLQGEPSRNVTKQLADTTTAPQAGVGKKDMPIIANIVI